MSIRKKLVIFLLFLFLLAVAFSYSDKIGLCELSSSETQCRKMFDNVSIMLILIFVSTIPFSLITYRMKEQIFQRWFRFAVWAVPALVVAFFVFPTSVRGGFGIGSMITEGFNTIILIIFFSAFFITSIVKIVRAYKENK